MICNTRLSLSLGSSAGSTTINPVPVYQNPQLDQQTSHIKSTHDQESHINRIPSLTLGLSSSSEQFTSSFSNSSVKREREASQEEEVVQLDIMSKVVTDHLDHDEDLFGSRKKLRLNKEQSEVLEDSFKEHSTLNSKQKQDLATRLNLRPRQVEVWFQNRRARTKLKQTEVDCETVRKCYEKLQDENRRLNKELQELKALKTTSHFRMQLSAATLSICPSCERTSGAGNNSVSDKKLHFYSPFVNPSSAAC